MLSLSGSSLAHDDWVWLTSEDSGRPNVWNVRFQHPPIGQCLTSGQAGGSVYETAMVSIMSPLSLSTFLRCRRLPPLGEYIGLRGCADKGFGHQRHHSRVVLVADPCLQFVDFDMSFGWLFFGSVSGENGPTSCRERECFLGFSRSFLSVAVMLQPWWTRLVHQRWARQVQPRST